MRLFAVLISAALAATAVGAVLSSSGSAQSNGGSTLQLFEQDKASTFGYVDNPPKGTRQRPKISAGDYFVFGGPLLDQAKKQRLGRIDVQCTITGPAKKESRANQLCTGALRLKNGTIALTASVHGSPKTTVAAVTGGTGAYNGARGTLISKDVKEGSQDTVNLLP